jgi:gliding motility-associated-like protein
MKTTARICSDEYYTLPWGQVVNTANIYQDTLKTINGCDSLIREVNLQVSPAPFVQISKSNDIDCITGNTQLKASGGVKYLWSPAGSLSNAFSSLTTATPDKTTMYTVTVTSADNCRKQDSILVKVSTGDAQAGYLVPSAFTPNGDNANDTWHLEVANKDELDQTIIKVYNKKGLLLYEADNFSKEWDGKYNGELVPVDTYYYTIVVKLPYLRRTFNGVVTILY